jgi:hypothetical protein
MPDNITQIPAPRVDLIEPNTGVISRQWFRYFNNLNTLVGGGLGVFPVSSGGTGLSTIPTNGQLLIGNGTGYTLNTLAVNNGISVVNGLGTITLDNTGVLSNTAGAGILVSNATGNITITNTGVLSFSGGTTGLTPVTATTGNVTLAGTLAIANGGTNTNVAPSAYGVVFGNSGGTAYTSLANGTTGQVLSATTGGAPSWSSVYTGTVTSVSFTGGIISVATPTTTPAFTVAGTSGGIPYFASGTTWASSAALASNAIVLGGGAGAAPATTTTGTGVVTALGVNTGTAGAFVVNGGALGTPSSGTVTNLTGTASININGTVGATTPSTVAATSISYTTTLTGGTGIVAIGTNQIYKDASGNVGLGTTVPDSRLTINKNSAAPAAIVGTPYLNIVGANSDSPKIYLDAYGSINQISFRRANGTQAAPSALLNGEQMANISVFGYGATGYTTSNRGFITFNADENWTDAAQGSRIAFATTSASTAAAATERMRINSSGNVGIGTTSPSASAILDAQSTTKGVRFPNMTTAQKNAIAAPAAGLVVFDTTLAKLCVYSGAAWQTITSV